MEKKIIYHSCFNQITVNDQTGTKWMSRAGSAVFTYDVNFNDVQWELILIVTQVQGQVTVGQINTLIRGKPHVPN